MFYLGFMFFVGMVVVVVCVFIVGLKRDDWWMG